MKYYITISIASIFLCLGFMAGAQTTIQVFDAVLFFDGYAARVDVPAPPPGVIRHRNDLYARKLTSSELASIGTTLSMRVTVAAACDNYDRIGNVNMAFVPAGSTTYNPNYVQRIELGRFITPFMNKNVSPNSVPYTFTIDNVAQILKDSVILSKYDIWVELEIFGVPYAANTQVAGCAGRNDVFFGSLVFETNTPAAPLITDNVLIPLSMKKNFNNYNINNTDTLGKTTRTFNFDVPVNLSNATFYLITSNHGANSGGEEYNRRMHYVYVDEQLSLTYKPGRLTCEPFRVYNTQSNGIYGPSPRTDAQWQSFSNWCPGDVIDIRKIEFTSLTAGPHSFKISVPAAVFTGSDGNFPLSVYLQGKKAANISVPPPPLPPVNNDPCNAISLGATATCSYSYFSNGDASSSVGTGNPNCANYVGGDVWFRVTVPTNGSVIIDTKADGLSDAGMAAYSGSCNNLTLLACDDNSGDGNMPNIALNNLTPNTSVWIRVWNNNSLVGGSFGICVSIPPPVYDEPCNAIEITSDFICANRTLSNISATATSAVPDPGCANYSGTDVWLKTVVPANGILEIRSTAGGIRNGGMALYTGSCDNLTLIACDDSSGDGDMPLLAANNLVPGSTVFIRYWNYGGTASGSFNICAVKQPLPYNDEPCNPEPINMNTTCNYEINTNLYAGPSASVPDPGCADYRGKDVWFSTIIPAGGKVEITTRAGTLADAGMAAYTGNCNSLNFLACNDDVGSNAMPSINLESLTPGDTLWIRVWSKGASDYGSFDICAIDKTLTVDSVELAIYPNPANSFLKVEGKRLRSLRLIDMGGRTVFINNNPVYLNMMNLDNLVSGVYSLQIITSSGIISRKVVVAR